MTFKHENDLVAKTTHENATLASSASDGRPREHYASNEEKETGHIMDPANRQRICDHEDTMESLCKSTRDTRKQTFVPGTGVPTDPSRPSIGSDSVDPLSKFPCSREGTF
jgi:hypothetical protein